MFKSLMFKFLQDIDNYDKRKIARTKIDGFIILTANTSDCGYETAIIDNNGAHPVERYDDKTMAEINHEKWVEFCKKGNGKKVKRLGWLDLIKPKNIILKRIEE